MFWPFLLFCLPFFSKCVLYSSFSLSLYLPFFLFRPLPKCISFHNPIRSSPNLTTGPLFFCHHFFCLASFLSYWSSHPSLFLLSPPHFQSIQCSSNRVCMCACVCILDWTACVFSYLCGLPLTACHPPAVMAFNTQHSTCQRRETSQLSVTLPLPIGNHRYSSVWVQSIRWGRNTLDMKMQWCFRCLLGSL